MKKTSRSFSWRNRDKDLQSVKRYHRFDVMFYRTDLLIHSQRVPEIVKVLLPGVQAVYPSFDGNLVLQISKFHDDFEMASRRGDIPLQLKLCMSNRGLSKVKQEEIAAAELLSRSYRNPKIAAGGGTDIKIFSCIRF